MKIKELNAKYIIPVSIKGKVVELFFDGVDDRFKEYFCVRKPNEVSKILKRKYSAREEENEIVADFCKAYTSLMADYSSEFKEALGDDVVTDPWAWMAFEKANQKSMLMTLKDSFAEEIHRYGEVVTLIKDRE